jgi:hypothetical protein
VHVEALIKPYFDDAYAAVGMSDVHVEACHRWAQDDRGDLAVIGARLLVIAAAVGGSIV